MRQAAISARPGQRFMDSKGIVWKIKTHSTLNRTMTIRNNKGETKMITYPLGYEFARASTTCRRI